MGWVMIRIEKTGTDDTAHNGCQVPVTEFPNLRKSGSLLTLKIILTQQVRNVEK